MCARSLFTLSLETPSRRFNGVGGSIINLSSRVITSISRVFSSWANFISFSCSRFCCCCILLSSSSLHRNSWSEEKRRIGIRNWFPHVMWAGVKMWTEYEGKRKPNWIGKRNERKKIAKLKSTLEKSRGNNRTKPVFALSAYLLETFESLL